MLTLTYNWSKRHGRHSSSENPNRNLDISIKLTMTLKTVISLMTKIRDIDI